MNCKDELTEKEIYEALATITSKKSPGNDGLTKTFNYTFWNKVKYIFMDSLRESQRKKKSKYFTKTSNN